MSRKERPLPTARRPGSESRAFARRALTEPMTVGWHAVRRAKAGPHDVALVVGCGPIGLAVTAWLKVAGVQASSPPT